MGFGSKKVIMTADICFEGKNIEKVFSVNVVNTPYYTIDNLEFADKYGNTSYIPVSGGKVKKLFVTE